MTSSAIYATDVYHYDHVVTAMHKKYKDVDLIRRWEPTPQLINRLVKLRLPEQLIKIASRRMRTKNPQVRKDKTFWLSTILPALTIHTRRHLLPKQARVVAGLKARKVSRISPEYSIIQFVEGLGYKLLQNPIQARTICECRTHHHSRFNNPWPLKLQYPEKHNKFPVSRSIDYEHTIADRILVYSQASKRSFEDKGYPSDKIVVCPLPLPQQLPRINVERDPHRIVFVGRSDPYKGLDMAVAIVQSLGAPYRLSVAGPMTDAVQQWINNFPFVEYKGILTREQLRDLYSSSAIYLSPSEESFGLAAADAVYHGCYLICSDWTGIAEYIPSRCVRSITGRDVKEWVHGVRAWAKRPTDPDFTEIDKTFEALTEKAVAQRLYRIYSHLDSQQ